MGVTRCPGWEEERWDRSVRWRPRLGSRDHEKPPTAEHRAWELIKGDFEYLPDSLKNEPCWESLYRGVYAAFDTHKSALCQAEAPTILPFGPETWERVNVSADFKHSVMCLSRWYDDLVLGALDSQDDLYLRDIAVYRRHNKTYNLDPSRLAFDVLEYEDAECGPSRNVVPLDAVLALAAAVNEHSAECRAGSLTNWKGPWRDLFFQMPVRRLLLLEDDSYLQSWVCGDSVFGDSDNEDDDGDAAAMAALRRHQSAELLHRIMHTRLEGVEAGTALSLVRAAAADLALCPTSPEAALDAIRYHSQRLGLRGVAEGLAGVQPGDLDLRPHAATTLDRKRGLLQRVMAELRHFVFPGLTDEEIEEGVAEATVLYLSDSDVWQDGPGTNEHQPAANLAFFHRDLAVVITSHVPHS